MEEQLCLRVYNTECNQGAESANRQRTLDRGNPPNMSLQDKIYTYIKLSVNAETATKENTAVVQNAQRQREHQANAEEVLL